MLSILPLEWTFREQKGRGDRGRLHLALSVCSEGMWLTSLLDSPAPPQPVAPVLGSSGLCSCDLLRHVWTIFPASINFIWPSRSRRHSYFSFWLCNISATVAIISQQSHYWGQCVPSTVVRVSTTTFNSYNGPAACKHEKFSDSKCSGHSLLLGMELER